ncbi:MULTISPECIES: DMT family transporter [Thermomonosporaceae]|uniref:DMT family transporter n=1 Tax=Thermomonosporaceae TaxID=2012 RepID=UPI00255A8CBC|nr:MULTISPECIES: DMT family transporter [Thermomonosporaceae]MDL4776375.1 DMT family transporter [Actinomadura xylanilytica]
MERIDPRILLVAGAACLSVSAIFVSLSGVSAGTAALFRCALALPVLLPLFLWERRRSERGRRHGADLLAGLLLGADLVLWGASITLVGAGIATVLVNVQVIVLPLLALAAFGERPSRRFVLAVPIMLGGVALAGGLAGAGAGGTDPARGLLYGAGAGVMYAGYLFLTRLAGRDGGRRFSPVFMSTLTAGAVSVVIGVPWNGVDLTPGWAPFGWLAALAMSGQVCGWLLIGAGLSRVRAETGGTLLLLQPILAVLFGVVLLGERPTPWQIAGCALVVAAVRLTGGRRRTRSPALPRPPATAPATAPANVSANVPDQPRAGSPASTAESTTSVSRPRLR